MFVRHGRPHPRHRRHLHQMQQLHPSRIRPSQSALENQIPNARSSWARGMRLAIHDPFWQNVDSLRPQRYSTPGHNSPSHVTNLSPNKLYSKLNTFPQLVPFLVSPYFSTISKLLTRFILPLPHPHIPEISNSRLSTTAVFSLLSRKSREYWVMTPEFFRGEVSLRQTSSCLHLNQSMRNCERKERRRSTPLNAWCLKTLCQVSRQAGEQA